MVNMTFPQHVSTSIILFYVSVTLTINKQCSVINFTNLYESIGEYDVDAATNRNYTYIPVKWEINKIEDHNYK